MIGRTIQLFRKNVSILTFYAVYMLVMFLIIIALYPKDLNYFTNLDPYNFDYVAYISMMVKILLASVFMFFLGILFFAGYGNMITEAVLQERTSAASFIPGIKKYFVRVLLASLLMVAFSIGASIVLSMILIPITILAVMNGSAMGLMISFLSMIVIMLVIPFVILWLPSIFIDDVGVIQGMKNGARVGTRSYGKLLLLLFAIYVPIFIYMLFNYDAMTQGVIMTPGYYAICVLVAIMGVFILPMLFMIYESKALLRK